MNKNKAKLITSGFHPTFQYRRYSDNSVMTRCILEDENRKPIAIGYSFCSPLDVFRKSEGRNKSEGRAIAALENNKGCFAVNIKNISKHEAGRNRESNYLGFCL